MGISETFCRTSTQLQIIGLGVSARAELSDAACQALTTSDLVVGSERQLETVAHLLSDNQQQLELPRLPELKQRIVDGNYGSVAILASGDPLYYGIGRWFSRTFAREQLRFFPAISSVQAACHALGLALQDVEVLSLHGRPVEKLRTRLRRNQPLLLLTDKKSCPSVLARICRDCGFDRSRLTVLEALGYPQQRIRSFSVEQLIDGDDSVDPLHLTLIEPAGDGWLPQFPGIPDAHFITDGSEPGRGMISKREVRLAILSLLQLAKGERVWDIGAGCGGVAVELAYWQPDADVVAIEHHPERLDCLHQNRQRFGVVANLRVVEGRAPEVLESLERPDKVFVGGSDGELPSLLQQLWAQLPQGGVLVASAVTETTRAILAEFWQQRQVDGDSQCDSVQVGVARGEALAGQLCFKPNLPVALFRFEKQPQGDVGEHEGER